jgi:nucleotide-binding universal stress UspA family protein
MIFDRVLMPLDLKQGGEEVAECSMQLIGNGMKEVMLLHVVQGEASQDKLEHVAEKMRAQGLHVNTMVVKGDPVKEIVREAKKLKATLIIMGSSGKTKGQEFLIGSVSLGVIRSTTVPILIARTVKKEGVSRLEKCPLLLQSTLVCVDLETSTKPVIKVAEDLCSSGAKNMTIFHVIPSSKVKVHEDGVFEQRKKELEALSASVSKKECWVDAHIHYGTYAYNILEGAREIDATLIVMGNHGKSLFHTVALGSTSDSVIRQSPVAVLIVPI